MPYIDLFLADVKCLDPKKARRYTKADARLSRENLLRLSEKKKPVILRMPLAAGVNDTLEEARARRRLMEKLDNVVRVDCFPVTGHAASKYRALGRKMTVWNQGTDGEEMVKRMEQWMGLEDFGKEIV